MNVLTQHLTIMLAPRERIIINNAIKFSILIAVLLALSFYAIDKKLSKPKPAMSQNKTVTPIKNNKPTSEVTRTNPTIISTETNTQTKPKQSELQKNSKRLKTHELEHLNAVKLIAAFKKLTPAKTAEQQAKFYQNSKVMVTLPTTYKSMSMSLAGNAHFLFSHNPDEMVSIKVITKTGSITDSDKKFLETDVIGFNLSEYEEVDASQDIKLKYENIKVYKGSRNNLTSYGVLVYDPATNKSVAIIFDGHPFYVRKNIENAIKVVNSLQIQK